MANTLPITLRKVNNTLFWVAWLLFAASPAAAQGAPLVCGDRSAVEKFLRDEAFQIEGNGIALQSLLAEIYVHPQTREWVWVLTAPTGQACFVADGQNWSGEADQGT